MDICDKVNGGFCINELLNDVSPLVVLKQSIAERYADIDKSIVDLIVQSTIDEIRKSYIIAGKNSCCRHLTDFN